MPYHILYAVLGLAAFGVAGALFGCYFTRRIYQRKLSEAQADAAQGWAEYQEVLAVAARWKRVYQNLKASTDASAA
jgi:hypothetical protein